MRERRCRSGRCLPRIWVLLCASPCRSASRSSSAIAEALTELAPQLPADLLDRALGIAVAITGDDHQAKALGGLAPYLPAELLRAAVTRATELPAPWTKIDALVPFVPHLPDGQRTAVLMEIAAATAAPLPSWFNKDRLRVKAMTAMAPYLREEALVKAVAAAGDLELPESRAKVLMALASNLPSDRKKSVFKQALTAATMTKEDIRADALANLAPHLSPDLLARAITAAAAIQDEDKQVAALGSLAPYADATQLARAIAARPGSRNNLLQAAISARTRNGLSAESWAACVEVIRAGMTGADHYEIVTAIGSAASAIAEIAGAAAIDDCVQAINAVCRWWN